ncbi:arylsulfatase precursor [Colletotrichum truncatum]|uniref:Arylsulfatase n=1 Tax=Colletotrichum truncatum TaxID=5467 RepID=A0ACC3YRJ1_COLTU|nr:arylsulfatase precursor [Colletotrichum truncatum]KAF6799200.1 arylsulfatase precursor [Colletotrichum truncatum]
MTDDQDRRLGSTDYQSVLHKELIAKGTDFTNHWTTTAQCCPSRAGLLRGQQSHNTNITHVAGAGGSYDKWTLAGEDNDYLPHWLKKAGYRVEYIGKLLNGYNTVNYNSPAPKGWDFINSLTDPYTMDFNNIVMSENGARPRHYPGFHQTDIIRTQSLDRLEYLTSQEKPFFLTIAPTVPHENYNFYAPVPLLRHKGLFPNATAPRSPNWNPSDEFQQQKSNWMKKLRQLNETEIEHGDWLFRQRIESLQGVDEIIEDVVNLLEEKGVIDNTYIIYTTDNGWTIGANRVAAGKATPYADDTNLPFVVRGPGVPGGIKSALPGAHIDLAPTFLEIAGVQPQDLPEFLDGRSLFDQWLSPESGYEGKNEGVGKELLNVEFWGSRIIEAPAASVVGSITTNSYKTLRLVGDEFSWLFIKWCTNEMELYNTQDDPYELTNLINSTSPSIQRLLTRLNAVLLVTKSCTQGTCRDPWTVLQPPDSTTRIASLQEALSPSFDPFFSSLPEIRFKECMQYQYAPNEEPFYPPGAADKLSEHRRPTDNFVDTSATKVIKPDNTKFYGGPEQRNVKWADVRAASRALTDDELGGSLDLRSFDERDVLEWYN